LTSQKKAKETNVLELLQIKPKTINQQKIFNSFDSDQHLFIHGFAGTGKTFIALYLALEAVLEHSDYDNVTIVRSAVPSRKQGFLPGNDTEKNEVFELPYYPLVGGLFNRPDAYKQLKSREVIKFLSTSYLRGLTLNNSVIIVDEVQNMNFGEVDTIVTRTGDNCKLILIGDTRQNDLKYQNEDSCIDRLQQTINRMKSFDQIEMGIQDICRNKVVKEWLIAQSV